ncbi:MAG: FecR domain-containing protein [Gammaproteobacteria bacterium]
MPLAVLAVIVLAVVAVVIATLRVRATSAPQALRLPDGTEVFFLGDTRIAPASSYPSPREITVDGDAFFRVPASPAPLIVRTRLLVLTVTGGSAFRITAYSRETGEQVEVLRGHVQAHKAYPSSYSEPDILAGGEMTMINQTIDLMEKETFDPAKLRAWSDRLIASVAAGKSAAARDH